MSKQMNKGISLIVLVITVIVMLILAGTVILSITSNGIIDKAQEAVEKANLKQIEQIATLGWTEAFLKETAATKNDAYYQTEVINYLKSNGVTQEQLNKYTITATESGVSVVERTSVNEGTRVVWNTADTEGLTTVEYQGEIAGYKISDLTPVELEGATTTFVDAGTGETTNIVLSREDETIVKYGEMCYQVADLVFVILKNNLYIEGLVFPEAGIYFITGFLNTGTLTLDWSEGNKVPVVGNTVSGVWTFNEDTNFDSSPLGDIHYVGFTTRLIIDDPYVDSEITSYAIWVVGSNQSTINYLSSNINPVISNDVAENIDFFDYVFDDLFYVEAYWAGEIGECDDEGNCNPQHYDTWNAESLRTIDFGETEQEVTDEFYEWLTENATKQ